MTHSPDTPLMLRPFPMPHPTDWLPDTHSAPSWNAKMFGDLDRGMSPIGGTGLDNARSMLHGVHPWLPHLFTALGGYLGVPQMNAGRLYGQAPAFTNLAHGPTPLLEQASQAAEAARTGIASRNSGGLLGLMSTLPTLFQASQAGLPGTGLSLLAPH